MRQFIIKNKIIVITIFTVLVVILSLLFAVVRVISKYNSDNRVATARLIVTNNDIIQEDRVQGIYERIINSDRIINTIKQKYKDVKKIELKIPEDTEIIELKYVCDEYDDYECRDIENIYIRNFSNELKKVYNFKLKIIDPVNITKN